MFVGHYECRSHHHYNEFELIKNNKITYLGDPISNEELDIYE